MKVFITTVAFSLAFPTMVYCQYGPGAGATQESGKVSQAQTAPQTIEKPLAPTPAPEEAPPAAPGATREEKSLKYKTSLDIESAIAQQAEMAHGEMVEMERSMDSADARARTVDKIMSKR